MRFYQRGGYTLEFWSTPSCPKIKFVLKLVDLLRSCKYDQKNMYLLFYNSIAVKCGGGAFKRSID